MSVDDEIARFDWTQVRTYLGYAEMVPRALRGLIAAEDDHEATHFGAWIERILLSEAGPCEGCAPVATVLVATLPEMTPPGHTAALDVLSLIAAAEITGPAHEQIGTVDIIEIRHAVAAGFQHYLEVLQAGSSPTADLHSCVDLLDVLAFYDRSLAPAAIATLQAVRTSGHATDLTVAIDNTLADLTGS
ncbi:hypothetical protein Aab01nite_11310 [Paractinoplanes abujensis]|uniref:Uncharacterized protein n=1 Tax=Paractinoplanes abujensis TaxID=882441 RepID=A0A7W7G1V6_9ACTN|nr:hypothetical protein [Actinoplanes abujensis]MBB4691046.1 hypothetical protein [Actinoplanes abujensis]GID17541.1 hypothetical protein Aab01nite_11310 [Actinoplanes abujensis]